MLRTMTRRARPVLLVAALLVGLIGVQGQAATAAPAAPAVSEHPADPVAHDPTIVQEGGWYYVAITGDAARPHTFLPMKRSRDLVHWQELGPVFTALPRWIVPALGLPASKAPKDLWAPDLSYAHGEWRLYYAASSFGKNTSVIGLATTRTLDPSDPRYGWHDRGVVVRSKDSGAAGGTSFNAIDPSVTKDRAGALWLSFGSFFSGVYLHRLDAATGRVPAGDVARHIAERAAPDAEENSTIVYRDGWYTLFLSFDNCCRSVESDYRTVVARSRSIAGPYVDRAGTPMLGQGGTELMRGYDEFVGAGGADVLLGAHGRDLVVNHYYDATDRGTPRLNVRRLSWDAAGWPRVSEPIDPSRTVGHGDAYVAIRPERDAATAVADAGCGDGGTAIALGRDAGTACQQWQISDRGAGSRILGRSSNDVAENTGCKNVDGGAVGLFDWLAGQGPNPCQRWTFATDPRGWTTISSVQAGSRSWTVATAAAGTRVVIDRPVASSAAQRFRLQPVGRVLLGDARDGTRTLGTAGDRVVPQRRDPRAGQTWRFVAIAGTARYRVVSADGRWLVAAAHGLALTSARDAGSTTGAWTLAPSNHGTWTLASGATSRGVRLLLP